MRIAQIAPTAESVPPKYYGGTERIVSYLTEELVREGHEVTLFASGDSVTEATLVAAREESCRLHAQAAPGLPVEVLMLAQWLERADTFDVSHFHLDFVHFPTVRCRRNVTVTTAHGRLDLPDVVRLLDEFRDIPLVSISDAQRQPVPSANWQSTVYHGLPKDLYRLQRKPGDYLAFLGRVSPEKGVEQAIAIARQADMQLKIAAKVDPADQDYYEANVKPLLDDPHVEYLGEIGDADKQEFLGNAYALLFTVNWPEPFGIVMAEAMACGTPIVAFRCGSVAEVMDHGRTGFVVTNVEEAVAAVRRVGEVDRAQCRAVFEQRFTAERMARDYLAVYEKLTGLGRGVCTA